MTQVKALPLYLIALLAGLFGVCPPAALGAGAVIHHGLEVEVHPDRHTFQVRDTVTVPASYGRTVEFILHRGLQPQATGARLETVPSSRREDAAVPVQRYRATLVGSQRSFVVRYGGEIYHPLQQVPSEERQFRVTPGLISTQGVYLDSSSAWFPVTGGGLVTFTLDVRLPGGWDAVSQGERRRHRRLSGATRVRWVCNKPQDDIYLIAARFHDYQARHGNIQLEAFLRTPDKGLAMRYTKAAGRYIDRYQELLGPYPYKKFALVENFWQSGYAMPSFTLLGSEIIRFPFIIYTSYPHEILHDWWGNGVFVNFDEGNWSEGLTAYLSDHLIQEQEGKGADYRREVLQKYTDFVASDEDFPLTEFTARNSQASEAVGYGKALMFFHMLRRQLGDATFVKALRLFYRDNKFQYATYDDIRRAFEKVTGRTFKETFDQWVRRTGAPDLHVAAVDGAQGHGKFRVRLTLEQSQPGPAYRLEVPIAVTVQGRARAYQTTVTMQDKRRLVTLSPPGRPLRVDVDPQFDLFRRLSKEEVPPALSGLFGAESVLIVLPSAAPDRLLQAYRALAEAWRASPAFHVRITMDNAVRALPHAGAVWVFGWRNRFRARIEEALHVYGSVSVADNGDVQIGGRRFPAADRSLVLSVAAPGARSTVMGWLTSRRPQALAGLARKLPHYTKYSYLVFQGDEPQNIARGMWPVMHSPMTVMLDHGRAPVPMATLAPRRPLIQLIDAGSLSFH